VLPQADPHPSPQKVFISHIAEEAPVALALKEFIEKVFDGQVSVFASSDVDDMLGEQWLRKIETALEECGVFLILCSPASLTRPWVNFETGCGWIRGKKMIPICHLGQSKDELPIPFSVLHGLELDDQDLGKHLVNALARNLKIGKAPRGYGGLRSRLNRARRSITRSDASPHIIHSPEERTRLLNNDLQALLKSGSLHKEAVWASAFLSAFATGPDDSYPPEKQAYLELILKEKKLLLDLARKGCNIKCIISPANENYIRHVGIQHALLRTRRLIEFLESGDRALGHIDWAISELGTKNLYIVGHISCFEGYKTSLDLGYGLTLRQTSRDVIRANLDLYQSFFDDLAARTLANWAAGNSKYSQRRDLLRIGAIQCLQKSLGFLAEFSQLMMEGEDHGRRLQGPKHGPVHATSGAARGPVKGV
jgi:hypothetical protein